MRGEHTKWLVQQAGSNEVTLQNPVEGAVGEEFVDPVGEWGWNGVCGILRWPGGDRISGERKGTK